MAGNIFMVAMVLVVGGIDTAKDNKEDPIQMPIDIKCSNTIECMKMVVDFPPEAEGSDVVTVEYLTLSIESAGWDYGVDMKCVGGDEQDLCGNELGRLPCATRYPSPVFRCDGNIGEWMLVVTAASNNSSDPQPQPFKATGTLWFCLTVECVKGGNLNSFWKPFMYIGIAISTLLIGLILYRRCLVPSGGSVSRSSDSSSLTMLWHSNRDSSSLGNTWNSRGSSTFADSRYSNTPPVPTERSSIIAPKRGPRGGVTTTAL